MCPRSLRRHLQAVALKGQWSATALKELSSALFRTDLKLRDSMQIRPPRGSQGGPPPEENQARNHQSLSPTRQAELGLLQVLIESSGAGACPVHPVKPEVSVGACVGGVGTGRTLPLGGAPGGMPCSSFFSPSLYGS